MLEPQEEAGWRRRGALWGPHMGLREARGLWAGEHHMAALGMGKGAGSSLQGSGFRGVMEGRTLSFWGSFMNFSCEGGTEKEGQAEGASQNCFHHWGERGVCTSVSRRQK